jgi:hypothetical protein
MTALRVEPIEEAVPRQWRRVVRDYPMLSMAVAAATGLYLGRVHGKRLLVAIVGVAVSAAIENARRAAGLR